MVVLGKLHKDPGAHIRGEQFELDLGMGNAIERLAPILAWFKSGLLLGRPIPPQVAWIWWIVGLHFLIYLIVAILLPKPVAACVNVLDEKAVQSFFVGLLALILFGPLALILVSSLIGLLVGSLPHLRLHGGDPSWAKHRPSSIWACSSSGDSALKRARARWSDSSSARCWSAFFT